LRIFQATIEGTIARVDVEWTAQSSACVVLASAGYPGAYETGLNISGLDRVLTKNDSEIFHAGTSKSEAGEFITAGGRVLGVTAAAPTLEQALASCYGAIENISWPGMQYRRDIGHFNDTLKASN
jgi:phosphoribosylamine--glycine ligase